MPNATVHVSSRRNGAPTVVTAETNASGVLVHPDSDGPGFSAFAVAVTRADLAVTDASLGATEVTAGDRASVTVTVENDGTKAGSRTVSVPAGGERTVTLTWTPTEAGTFEVTVGDARAGSLAVRQSGETTTTATPTTTAGPTTTADGDDAGPGLVLVVALAVLVALVVVALYLRREGYLDGVE